MATSVFIDGQAGTIGLRIHELLDSRSDLTMLRIPDQHRKDPNARRDLLNGCDIAILCLPDDASIESVSLITNPHVRVIDGSTAFRTSPDWVYGLPEIAPDQRRNLRAATRISNPGCWASCVCLLVRPLIEAGILPANVPLSIHGVSGYSGAGRTGIRRWEDADLGLANLPFEALYGLETLHKHIPEIRLHGHLTAEPCFRPSIGPFARGMRVEIPLHASMLRKRVANPTCCGTAG